MNITRSKKISDLYYKLEELKEAVGDILSEEEDYFGNLSEKQQESEKGEQSQTSISNLEDAVNSIDAAVINLADAQLPNLD